MNEDKFDELLKTEQLTETDLKLEKRIRQSMNRTIYRKSLKVLLCTCLCFGICTFGISKLLDTINYNPASEGAFLNEKEKETAGFDVLTATYLNMYFPGVSTQQSTQFSKLGFGNYEITYPVADIFKPMISGNGNPVTINISRSHIQKTTGSDTGLAHRVYVYLDPDSDDSCKTEVLSYGSPEDEYAELLKLPDSAIIDVALSFPEVKDAKGVMTFIEKYPDSFFYWVALNTDELLVHGAATGFNLYESWSDELSDAANQQYPSFYLTQDTLNEEALTENYLSKLRLLANHRQFTQMMDEYFLGKTLDYEAKYQEALENGIQAIGIQGHLTKAELLEIIDAKEISHMTILQVKLSKYS